MHVAGPGGDDGLQHPPAAGQQGSRLREARHAAEEERGQDEESLAEETLCRQGRLSLHQSLRRQ